MVQAKTPRLIRGWRAGRLSGPGTACCWSRAAWEPGGAILGAETRHYTAAGVSGLNSSADWESVDCNFYRITIERIGGKKQAFTQFGFNIKKN